MKVLITGGAGFIGSHVTDELLQHNFDVILLDNLETGNLNNINQDVKLYNIDINDPSLENVFSEEKPDAVVHLAAQTSVVTSLIDPYHDFYTNTNGTINLLLLCKKHNVNQFIFSSSAAVYGEPTYLPIDEHHSKTPQSFYAVSKYCAENYIQLSSELFNINTSILRFSNVYGPRQNNTGEAGVVSIFINQMLRNEKVTVYGGDQTRDFIYVEDVAKACRLALEKEKSEIYNLSSNSETSILALLDTISKELGVSIIPEYQAIRKGEIIRSKLDNRKAGLELNWHPQYSLLEGLNKTIKYYASNYTMLQKKY